MFPPMRPRPTKPSAVVAVSRAALTRASSPGTDRQRDGARNDPVVPLELVLAQAKLRRGDAVLDVAWTPCADDRDLDGRIGERPGDREPAHRDAHFLRL